MIALALALALAASPSIAPDWTPVAASAVIPGSGQYLQGQESKALGQFGAALLCAAAYFYGQAQADNATDPTGVTPNLRTFASVGLIGVAIWSPLDAWLFESNHAQGQPADPAAP